MFVFSLLEKYLECRDAYSESLRDRSMTAEDRREFWDELSHARDRLERQLAELERAAGLE